jgi:hypothetical protein
MQLAYNSHFPQNTVALPTFHPEMTAMAKTAKPPLKKLPAVRLIVKELGVEASVAEVRKALKEQYDFDMTDAVAQNYVSKARRDLRNGKSTRAKVKRSVAAPMATPTPVPVPVPAPVKAMTNGAAIRHVVEAVSSLKSLVGTLGKDNLLKLVEAM